MPISRLAAAHPQHRRIVRGAMFAGLFVVLAKLGAVAREIAIAWGYGTSGVVDAFQLSLSIATWLPMVIAGMSTGLLVPRLVGVRSDTAERNRFVAELNGAAVALGVLAMVVTAAAAVPAVELIGGGLQTPVVHLAVRYTFALLPVSFLSVMVALFYARLQAREQQVFAITEAVPPLLIALLIVISQARGGTPLIIGMVAGTLLQVFLLWMLAKAHAHGVGGVSVKQSSREWGNIYRDLFTLTAAQALITLALPVDNAFAARAGAGGIATYGYAIRLLGLFVSFGSLVFARAILPVLSDVAASSDHVAGRRVARKWSGLLLLFGIAVGGVVWVGAPIVVRLAFQRGAFTAEDAAAVTSVLRFGLFQLPFSFGALAMTQWFAAAREYRMILWAAAAALVAKLACNFVFFPALGLSGLSLATAAMYAVSMGVMLALLPRV